MSKKYKFSDNDKLYFVTFTVTDWVDLFIREEYREILVNSIKYCQKNKGLELYGWCIMTSHLHLIVGTTGNALSNIMRDLKRHTSEMLHKAIKVHPSESRREWILLAMERAAQKFSNSSRFQLWQPESHPVLLTSNKMAHQRLEYIHNNPVVAGFVTKPEDWKYSSAIRYYGGESLLEITDLPPLTI